MYHHSFTPKLSPEYHDLEITEDGKLALKNVKIGKIEISQEAGKPLEMEFTLRGLILIRTQKIGGGLHCVRTKGKKYFMTRPG